MPPYLPPPSLPPDVEGLTNATSNETALIEDEVEDIPSELILQPEINVRYMWSDGNRTSLKQTYAAPLRVAINEIDFRGDLIFTYYHQVMGGLACRNSSEYGMSSEGEEQSQVGGGDPSGGYAITLLGNGFDGYDGNASTVRVRFATEVFANGTAADGTATSPLLNSTAADIDVIAISLTATSVIVLAPSVDLTEGEILTKRAYPCWNPPCRRTIVTMAINGVDFVGRPQPLVFFFFHDPWRFLGLMERELILFLSTLAGLCVANAFFTWQFRFEVYERYLKLKYRLKNGVLYPIMIRDSPRAV